ncbi:MAG: TIGR00266 family protein, partial [Dehalococcoidia bacterium]
DGIFLATLTGPGRVWLQTLPLSGLAHTLTPYLPHAGERETTSAGVAGGLTGAVVKGIFNRD